MKSKSLLRLEWISLVYLGLFVLAVLSPSLVSQGYFGVDERHIEELLIFIFGITGMITFSIYERVMERKDQEHEEAKNEYERARKELIESYKYIGSVNRKIEVLKGMANQTSVQLGESQRVTRDLLMTLLSNAAASAGASQALLRYVILDNARTEHEIRHQSEDDVRVSNKELARLHQEGASHAFVQSEDERELLVVPSDHEGKEVKAFLIFVLDSKDATQADTSLLKVFANQAGLLYYTQAEAVKRSRGVLDLIDEAEKSVSGVVN